MKHLRFPTYTDEMLDFVDELTRYGIKKGGVMPLGALLEACLQKYGNLDAAIHNQTEWDDLVSMQLVKPEKSFQVNRGAVLPR